jgi:hypothetical protein
MHTSDVGVTVAPHNLWSWNVATIVKAIYLQNEKLIKKAATQNLYLVYCVNEQLELGTWYSVWRNSIKRPKNLIWNTVLYAKNYKHDEGAKLLRYYISWKVHH